MPGSGFSQTNQTSADLTPSDTDAVAVSIVVPVRNEAENVAPLIAEIVGALDGRWVYEIIYVNDGSTDATAGRLADLMKQHRQLRQLKHAHSSGQSAAVRSGVRAARGAIVATLDGDGQNNPVFLPDLIAAVENGGGRVGLVAGQRVGRKDTGFKKLQSRIANGVRKTILNDGTRDTGCGLKAFRRETLLPTVERCVIDRDLFSSELVIRAGREGVRVIEIPIRLDEKRPPAINLVKRVPNVLRGMAKLTYVIRFGGKP